ncbi:hypothetical protein [Dactylosporangium sp. NPDC005555]|uniref:hypothetical protein n=1 Tax=Dactylosporangium sp. NPDC005555 TaxID=3154889 RepID=UPI0033BA5AC3
MSNKRLIIGETEWTIDDKDEETVVAQVKAALHGNTTTEFVVLDQKARPVTLVLNGRATAAVGLDLDTDPRPGEIS